MAWQDRRRTSSDDLHPKKRQRILVQHGHICHLCGHGGANQVDHVIPWSEWTDPYVSVHDASNLRPAHGDPCATCGITCHEVKSQAEAARGRARGHERRRTAARRPLEPHPGAYPGGVSPGPQGVSGEAG